MKKILLIINQTALPGERSYTRYLSLYNLLNEVGYDVRIVTSIFNHYDKEVRDSKQFFEKYPNFQVSFIKEPGYKKNVSVKRFLSQCVFALNLKWWIERNGQEYDVVFMTVPTNEGAVVVGNYCNKHNIPYIVNVEDLWPEAMSLFIKPAILYQIVTRPMKWVADKAYSQANAITAVSQQYLERAKKVNNKSTQEAVVYLGTVLSKFDMGAEKYSEIFNKPEGEFWIAYIGTLGLSYDINTFIDAVHLLHKKGYAHIRAKILGRGPYERKFKRYARNIGADIDFVGFMPYEKMAGCLTKCDVMINAIKRDAAQSVVNKVGDYFASGKPTLNSCVQPEMRKLILDYNTGLNYEAENRESLVDSILTLYNNPELCKQLGKNARRLAEELFDRKNSYMKFVEIIDNLTK